MYTHTSTQLVQVSTLYKKVYQLLTTLVQDSTYRATLWVLTWWLSGILSREGVSSY